MPSKCQQCDKVANYGLDEILHCGDHRLPNEKNLRAKYCDECDKQASFGFLVPSKCSDHKLDDMTDLKHKLCDHPGCDKRQAKGSFCAEHGTGKNTKHRTCYCGKIASYSNEGGRPEFCNDHKEPGMVNVKNKSCQETNCKRSPSFGFPGTKKGIFCQDHKQENMINVTSKRCAFSDCDKLPSFNFKELKSVLFCREHKEEGMVEVSSKKCYYKDCVKRATYGILGEGTKYCASHKEPDMIDLNNKPCVMCKLMQPSCGKHCASCFYYLFPEHQKTRNHKTKENAIMEFIKKEYPDIILDKVIQGGCSRKRPDGLIDLLTHSIIIEIDEDQHSSYDKTCDNKRNMQMFEDLGDRPLVLIRFNPDSYTANSKKVRGCFSLSKTLGKLMINDKEMKSRIPILLKTISNNLSQPDKEITVIKLFFND